MHIERVAIGQRSATTGVAQVAALQIDGRQTAEAGRWREGHARTQRGVDGRERSE